MIFFLFCIIAVITDSPVLVLAGGIGHVLLSRQPERD